MSWQRAKRWRRFWGNNELSRHDKQGMRRARSLVSSPRVVFLKRDHTNRLGIPVIATGEVEAVHLAVDAQVVFNDSTLFARPAGNR